MELSIFSFFTIWINIIFYVIIIINFFISNNEYILNTLSILYGLIWTISICGLIIHMDMKKIIAKYKKSKEYKYIKPYIKPYINNNFKFKIQVFNFTFHVLPLILIILYNSKKSNISVKQILHIYVILISIYIYTVDIPSNVYIGVPNWLLYGLAPIILISTTYYKKYKELN